MNHDIDTQSLGKHILQLALAFGAICIFAIVSSLTAVSGKEKVEATISDYERNEYRSDRKRGYYVYVDYTYDGVTYEDVKLGTFKYPQITFGEEGSDCTVYINKSNPTNPEHLNNIAIFALPVIIIVGIIGYRMKES